MGDTAARRPLALVWIAGIGLGYAVAFSSDMIASLVPWNLGHDRIVPDLVLMTLVPGLVVLFWSLLHTRFGARLPMWVGLLAGASVQVLLFSGLENPEGQNPLGAFGNAVWGPALVFAPLAAMAIAEIIHFVRAGRRHREPGEQARQLDAAS